jgi:CheY-like chemotaxis protein
MPRDRPLQGTRILIGEDNAILAFDLTSVLEGAGAEVVPARTVESVLAAATGSALTSAVLDLVLRGESVFTAAQALRERRVGIVFYTGYADLDVLRRDWPEAQVLSKPAPPELLLRTVCMACPTVTRS